MSKKEGFFENLFKANKMREELEEINYLNSVIDERNQIINQLKEELIDEKKKTGIDTKQLEIYGKNLKNKTEEISNLRKTKTELEENLNILNNNNEKNYLEIKSLNETNLKLEDELKEKLNYISTLKKQNAFLEASSISKDMAEEMQAKIDALNKLSSEQKEKITLLENLNSHKDISIKELKENLERNSSTQNLEAKYYLPISELFSASKFSELKNALINKGINLVDTLRGKNLADLLEEETKNIEAGTLLLENFFQGKMMWEIKNFLHKGDKLSKIFNRQRKLLNYLNDNYLEFASDLENFDFEALLGEGFTEANIKKFKNIFDEYNKIMKSSMDLKNTEYEIEQIKKQDKQSTDNGSLCVKLFNI